MEYDDNDDVDQNDHYTYGNDINEGLPYLAILFCCLTISTIMMMMMAIVKFFLMMT